jgi:hypothetical protein
VWLCHGKGRLAVKPLSTHTQHLNAEQLRVGIPTFLKWPAPVSTGKGEEARALHMDLALDAALAPKSAGRRHSHSFTVADIFEF